MAPRDPDNLAKAALVAMCQGRQKNAIALYQQELEIDPPPACPFSRNLRDLGRYDEAEEECQAAIEMNPRDIVMIHLTRGEIRLLQGRFPEALAEMEREPSHEFGVALAYHGLGRHAESDAALSHLVAQYGDHTWDLRLPKSTDTEAR